jgi:pimeloyl-ACP methyl ester carboxylesterase
MAVQQDRAAEPTPVPSPRVILLPGAVLPADLAYAALIDVLGDDAQAMAKELEVYADEAPSTGYSLDDEVRGVLREADASGWDRFHVVGYSGGGAAALALAASEPHRLLSLALLEPAWAGRWDLSPTEQAVWREYEKLEGLPSQQFMAAFQRLGLRPGVDPPLSPPGAPPPWMGKRPAGIAALMRTFETYELDREALSRFPRPVYYALGRLSNPDQYREIAERLARVFPDFTLEIFEERHHFDPPHRIEPERLARSLQALWTRALSLCHDSISPRSN